MVYVGSEYLLRFGFFVSLTLGILRIHSEGEVYCTDLGYGFLISYVHFFSRRDLRFRIVYPATMDNKMLSAMHALRLGEEPAEYEADY